MTPSPPYAWITVYTSGFYHSCNNRRLKVQPFSFVSGALGHFTNQIVKQSRVRQRRNQLIQTLNDFNNLPLDSSSISTSLSCIPLSPPSCSEPMTVIFLSPTKAVRTLPYSPSWSIIEFTTCFHEFFKHKTTNIFNNISQLKNKTNFLLAENGILLSKLL